MSTIYKWDNPVNWHTKQDQSHSQDQTSRSPLKWATRIHNSRGAGVHFGGSFWSLQWRCWDAPGFRLRHPSSWIELRQISYPSLLLRPAGRASPGTSCSPRSVSKCQQSAGFSSKRTWKTSFIISNLEPINSHSRSPFPWYPRDIHHPKLIQVMVTGPDPSAFWGIFLIRFRTSRGSVTCQS